MINPTYQVPAFRCSIMICDVGVIIQRPFPSCAFLFEVAGCIYRKVCKDVVPDQCPQWWVTSRKTRYGYIRRRMVPLTEVCTSIPENFHITSTEETGQLSAVTPTYCGVYSSQTYTPRRALDVERTSVNGTLSGQIRIFLLLQTAIQYS